MEQIARAHRGLKRRMAEDAKAKDPNGGAYLHWYWDDDGYLVIVGRFSPAEGAVFLEALNAARPALAGGAEKDQPVAGDSAESRTTPAEHQSAGDSAESETSSSHPADPAEARTSSSDPEGSAESLWATCDDDFAASLWVEDDDDYVHGYWMVPADDESGELVWVASEVPEEDDSAESLPRAPDGERDVPPAAESQTILRDRAGRPQRMPSCPGTRRCSGTGPRPVTAVTATRRW